MNNAGSMPVSCAWFLHTVYVFKVDCLCMVKKSTSLIITEAELIYIGLACAENAIICYSKY